MSEPFQDGLCGRRVGKPGKGEAKSFRERLDQLSHGGEEKRRAEQGIFQALTHEVITAGTKVILNLDDLVSSVYCDKSGRLPRLLSRDEFSEITGKLDGMSNTMSEELHVFIAQFGGASTLENAKTSWEHVAGLSVLARESKENRAEFCEAIGHLLLHLEDCISFLQKHRSNILFAKTYYLKVQGELLEHKDYSDKKNKVWFYMYHLMSLGQHELHSLDDRCKDLEKYTAYWRKARSSLD